MMGKIPQSVLLNRSGFTREAASLLAGLGSKQTEAVLGAVAEKPYGPLKLSQLNPADGIN